MSKKLSAIIVGLTFLFLSCATTIPVEFQRPAELDLNGASSVSVLPFIYSDSFENSKTVNIIMFFTTDIHDTDQKDICNYVTSELTGAVAKGGYYDLVSSTAVSEKLKGNTGVPCDIYITGKLSSYNADIDSKTCRREIGKDEYVVEYVYTKEVSCSLTYEIVDAKTSRVMYYDTKRISCESSTYDSETRLPSALSIIRSDLDNFASDIARKIQPYEETVVMTLLKDKTKNERMATADKLAKSRDIAASRSLFESVYKEEGLMEAGYNAAILYHAEGEYDKALSIINEIAKTNPTADVLKEKARIESDKKSESRLEKQLRENGSAINSGK